MKFKATLSHEGVTAFLSLSQALQKVHLEDGKCVLLLSPQSMELRVASETDTIRGFGKLETGCFRNISAVSKNVNNEISLLLTLLSLTSAFKSADKADEATLRLTKKHNTPVLTMTAQTLNGILVTHDVPIVKILTASEASRFAEPQLRDPQLTLNLPDPKHFKSVLERLKALDKCAKVKASSKGSLYVKVETELVTTCTVFQGLKLATGDDAAVVVCESPSTKRQRMQQQQQDNDGDDDNVALTASFSIKEMLTVAQGAVAVKPKDSVLAIVDGKVIVIHFALQEKASMTYYLITLVDEEDQDEAGEEQQPEQ